MNIGTKVRILQADETTGHVADFAGTEGEIVAEHDDGFTISDSVFGSLITGLKAEQLEVL